jgi:Rho GTPase-activating protein 1
MKAHIRNRARGRSLTTVAPPPASADYSQDLAKAASSILYQSPIRSKTGHAIYILNAAALPDTHEVEYDALLPYVISRLPGEDDLISGTEYEVVFFAGSGASTATNSRKNRPGWGWLIQAYHLLSRAMRKRIQKLYIVHERTWVRLMTEMFSTVVSPKFRRKIVHGMMPLETPGEPKLIIVQSFLLDPVSTPSKH